MIAAVLAFFVALVLTYLARRLALKRRILDLPNERSSHQQPTPRGGGAAVVLVFLGLLIAFWSTGVLDARTGLGLALGGGIIALVGFLDDLSHVPVRWRLLCHFGSAAVVVYAVGGLPPLVFWGEAVNLGWAGHLLAVLGLVWLLNLYNFMDGIDGIAGVEAVTAAFTLGFLLWLEGWPQLATLLFCLGAANAGFLCWNLPPARIFMGDVGSGFVGLMLGALGLLAAAVSPAYFWAALILLGVFMVDATITLFRRLGRGERVYQAHRSHAYQYAARRFGSHRPVTLAVALINLLWLFPLALAVQQGWLPGALGLLLAYAPLGILAWRLGAGVRESAA